MHYITDKCTGCTVCAQNCPVFAIDGIRGERHVVNKERCVDCGVCGKLCPAGAVTGSDGGGVRRVKRSELSKPQIEKGLCSACSLCVDICRFGCLSISLPQFRGDIGVFAELTEEKRCVGCGRCVSVCPMRAVSLSERGAAQ